MSRSRSESETRLFMVREFLRDHRIASIKATSPYLVQRICSRLDLRGRRVVVELGPGFGCFTRMLLERMSADSTLVAIDSNTEFTAWLSRIQDPRLRVVPGKASQLRAILRAFGVDGVDAVLSGIPFSLFSDSEKAQLIRDVRSALTDRGVFMVYQSTARLEKPLKRVFPKVRVERELFHIPPLAILEARAG